jgi:hypothetical protein
MKRSMHALLADGVVGGLLAGLVVAWATHPVLRRRLREPVQVHV